MRSLKKSFINVPGLVAVAGVMAFAPSAFAKDPVEVKSADKAAAAAVEGASAEAAIPSCLAKLELNAEQQKKIKEIVGENDAELAKVWTQFSKHYTQMIAAESAMLAAIEDNLTETQLVQVRTHRHRTARHGRKIVVTTTTKPAAKDNKDELDNAGVELTDEQAAASDKIQEMYHTNLHKLHQEIQGLHARLLALETDKLDQIEKVLTKEQMAQLKAERKTAPPALKIEVSEAQPTKAEKAE